LCSVTPSGLAGSSFTVALVPRFCRAGVHFPPRSRAVASSGLADSVEGRAHRCWPPTPQCRWRLGSCGHWRVREQAGCGEIISIFIGRSPLGQEFGADKPALEHLLVGETGAARARGGHPRGIARPAHALPSRRQRRKSPMPRLEGWRYGRTALARARVAPSGQPRSKRDRRKRQPVRFGCAVGASPGISLEGVIENVGPRGH
jgi:hypothetical protein